MSKQLAKQQGDKTLQGQKQEFQPLQGSDIEPESFVDPVLKEKKEKKTGDETEPIIETMPPQQLPKNDDVVPQLDVKEIKKEEEEVKLTKEEQQQRLKQAAADPDFNLVTSRVQKIAGDKEQHPLYTEKKRKSIQEEYDKFNLKVKKIGDEILKKSNKVGKRGLKRKEEISLREELIKTKSNAMKEYIKLTSGDKKTLARELVNEDYRMWVRLRNMYEAQGDYSKVKSAQKEIEKLEPKLKSKDLSYDENIKAKEKVDEEQEKLNRRIDERIRERDFATRAKRDEITRQILKEQGIGEDEKLEKYQQELIEMLVKERIEQLKENETAPEYKVDKVDEAIEEVKKLAWAKGFSEEEQVWLALYGKVNFSYRKLWLEKNPAFKKPNEGELKVILDTILAVWKDNHPGYQKDQYQRELLEKGRIPELKNAKSESMRLLVNGLQDSLYIFKTHKKGEEYKIDQPVALETQKEVKAGDPLKGYEYEKQDRGNDCWSVALASLVNFNLPKDKEKITQTTVRTQTPVFRKQAPGEEEEDYNRAKSGIEWFTTKNQGAVSHMGNIFAMSDFISGQVKDTAIRHMVFATPKCTLDDERNSEKNAKFNVTQVLKATIKKTLDSGQPIAVLKGAHYRVIVSADDNGVTMLNSAGADAHLDENVTYEDLMGSGDQLELTWLQKDVESLADEFKGLEKKDGKFQAKETDAVLDPDLVAITSGVVVHKKDDDIPDDVRDYISERVYIPQGLMSEPEVKEE